MAATGWLGWTPEVALTTPIPQIELAIDGLVDWTKKTNPWGSGEPEPDPETVNDRLKGAFRAMGARKSERTQDRQSSQLTV